MFFLLHGLELVLGVLRLGLDLLEDNRAERNTFANQPNSLQPTSDGLQPSSF